MRTLAVVVALLTALPSPSAAQEFQPLPSNPRTDRARPDLARQRDTLTTDRKALLDLAAQFDRRCAKVVKGSEDDRWCAQNFGPMRTRAAEHCTQSTTFITNYLQAMDHAFASTTEEKTRVMDELRSLQTKFQDHATAFDAATKKAKNDYDKAWTKLESVPPGLFGVLAIEASQARALTRLTAMMDKASELKNPRRLRMIGDLKNYVSELAPRLKGKTPLAIKRLVLKELRSDRDVVVPTAAVAGLAADVALRRIFEEPGDSQVAILLNDAYGTLITAVSVAATQGSTNVATLGKFAGIVSFFPTILDWGLTDWEAYVDTWDVDGMDALVKAAEEQRARASARLTSVITERRDLEAQRARARQSVQAGCR